MNSSLVCGDQPKPSPQLVPPITYQKIPAKGVDMGGISKPNNSPKVSWQKVVVGKENLNGAQLLGMEKKSPWRRLGFQQGDVILRIAGEDKWATLESRKEEVGDGFKWSSR